MKTIPVTADELYKQMPQWMPLTEWTLRSYLIHNPNLIAPNAKFLSSEVYRIDLIFEDAQTLFVVETKSNGGQPTLQQAITQLEQAKTVIERLNLAKKIEPVLCFISDRPPSFSAPKLKSMDKRIANEIDVLLDKRDKIQKEISSLEDEISTLRKKRISVKNWILRKEKSQKVKKIKRTCASCGYYSSQWCDKLDAPTSYRDGASCSLFTPSETKVEETCPV
jgi:hypothetical protein